MTTATESPPPLAMRIKTARQNQGLSIRELARRLDVSKGTIVNWETGDTTPGVTVAVRLADTLGVSLEWLLRDAPNN